MSSTKWGKWNPRGCRFHSPQNFVKWSKNETAPTNAFQRPVRVLPKTGLLLQCVSWVWRIKFPSHVGHASPLGDACLSGQVLFCMSVIAVVALFRHRTVGPGKQKQEITSRTSRSFFHIRSLGNFTCVSAPSLCIFQQWVRFTQEVGKGLSCPTFSRKWELPLFTFFVVCFPRNNCSVK